MAPKEFPVRETDVASDTHVRRASNCEELAMRML
jgi:hypothetical protein